jgi:prevent-host-death family protein
MAACRGVPCTYVETTCEVVNIALTGGAMSASPYEPGTGQAIDVQPVVAERLPTEVRQNLRGVAYADDAPVVPAMYCASGRGAVFCPAMRQVNVRDFQEQFGDFLVLARDEPVAVSKFGTPVAVLMSAEEFSHLQALEDLYWIDCAAAVEVTGEWIDHEEAVALLGIPSSRSIKRRLVIQKVVLGELLTLQPDQPRMPVCL